jgi:hypothetical protein
MNGALPPPDKPYPARQPDGPDAKHFPDADQLLILQMTVKMIAFGDGGSTQPGT